jgi:hypothetical protein
MIKPAMRLAWSAAMLFSAVACQAETPPPPQPSKVVAYRCGGPGDVRYQHHACEGGEPMTVRDQRTDEQRRDTARATQQDAQQARQLQRERRHRERLAVGQKPIAMDSAKPRHTQSNMDQDGNQGNKNNTPLKRKRHFTASPPKSQAPKTTRSLPAD